MCQWANVSMRECVNVRISPYTLKFYEFRISPFALLTSYFRKLQKPLPLGWAKGFWSFLLHRNFKFKLHTSNFIFPTLYFKFHISHFVFPISYFRLPFKETPKTFAIRLGKRFL